MKRNAFTMLELVLVIVVMGILASMAIPRMERDTRQEVADNILSAIRYTQHLALMDDKTDPTDVKWQMLLWHIRFSHYTLTNGDKRWFYTISSNSDHNENVDKNETAIDPQNGLYLFHAGGDQTLDEVDQSPNIFLGENYGVKSISFSGGCDSQHIAFDHIGRPYNGIYAATNDFSKIMKTLCKLTFGFEDGLDADPLIITIEPETGYASITGQPDA